MSVGRSCAQAAYIIYAIAPVPGGHPTYMTLKIVKSGGLYRLYNVPQAGRPYIYMTNSQFTLPGPYHDCVTFHHRLGPHSRQLEDLAPKRPTLYMR